MFSLVGHKEEVIKVEWSNFNMGVLASCSNDRRIIVKVAKTFPSLCQAAEWEYNNEEVYLQLKKVLIWEAGT